MSTHNERVRALSITQPFATLIALGLKKYETRSWFTPYRGTLLIHATKKWDPEDWEGLGDHYDMLWELGYQSVNDFPIGAVVAIGTLLDCKPADEVGADLRDDDDWCELEAGFFARGRWAWSIDVKPNHTCCVPARGYQGIWKPDIETVAAARGQVLDTVAGMMGRTSNADRLPYRERTPR